MKYTPRHATAGLVAGGALMTLLASPSVALAEDSAVGSEILIPKPAEFIPALIAFLIIFVILAKFIWPSVLQMMEKRQDKIQSDLDAAERSKIEAAEEAKACEAKLVEARREAYSIVSRAKKEAEEERARILAKAHREAADVIARAHDAVSAERHKATIELSSSVVDLSVEIATKIIGESLSEADQRKLAEKYLAEVGRPDGN